MNTRRTYTDKKTPNPPWPTRRAINQNCTYWSIHPPSRIVREKFKKKLIHTAPVPSTICKSILHHHICVKFPLTFVMILITDHQITAAVNLEDAEGDIKIITNQMLYRHLFATESQFTYMRNLLKTCQQRLSSSLSTPGTLAMNTSTDNTCKQLSMIQLGRVDTETNHFGRVVWHHSVFQNEPSTADYGTITEGNTSIPNKYFIQSNWYSFCIRRTDGVWGTRINKSSIDFYNCYHKQLPFSVLQPVGFVRYVCQCLMQIHALIWFMKLQSGS